MGLISSRPSLQQLEAGFGSQPEGEVGPWQWECWILATRPVASDKALVLWLCGKELPQRQKVVKQVKCLLGGRSVVHVDGCRQTHGESHSLVVFKITYMGHFFQVSFGQSFWFAWFWALIWFVSGSSRVCMCVRVRVHASFSRDGFQRRGLLVA